MNPLDHSSHLSTRSLLLAQCDDAASQIRVFRQWVAENPWLDDTALELAMPWFAYICIKHSSKGEAVLNFGEAGWNIGPGGELRKTAEGITVSILGD